MSTYMVLHSAARTVTIPEFITNLQVAHSKDTPQAVAVAALTWSNAD
jgi:hypothetical protein